MEYLDFCKEVCRYMNGTGGYPVSLYQGKNLIYHVERAHLPGDANFSAQLFEKLDGENQPVAFDIVDDCVFVSLVRSTTEGLSVLMGPICVTPMPEQIIHKITRMLGAGNMDIPTVRAYFNYAPILPFNYVTQMMSYLYLILNREPYVLADVLIHPESTVGAADEIFRHNEANQYDDTERHTSFEFEKTMLYYVQNGQTKNLLKFFRETPIGRPGTVAHTALRQEINNTIVGIALATRAAIAGGLSHEVAFQLSDITIQKLELCTTVQQVDELNGAFILDITERVAALQSSHCKNPLIKRTISYICDHVYDRLTVEEIADYFHTNRSFLSTAFKNEIGYTLNEYINRQKITEAKKLLRMTDKTLSEIASILTFSSQSHFQNTFKKITGLTPVEYRKN